MSHKVSTTLDDDTWAALDRFREQQGLVSESAALRRLVERLAAEEVAEIEGAGQMLSIHPTLRPQRSWRQEREGRWTPPEPPEPLSPTEEIERRWDDEDMMRESFASRLGHPGGHYG